MRREQVYQARTGSTLEEARRKVARPEEGQERIFSKTVDFVDVAVFERGRRAARPVARIITRDGAAVGTGFLVSPRLLMTNNHVIASKADAAGMLAEFDYERDIAGNLLKVTRFAFTPAGCFLTNDQDDLDYTVVAIGPRVMGDRDLASFGYIPLSNARNKHQLGDYVNIIQHPDGRLKEAVLRENQLVARNGTTLHYLASTEPGSSGSPVSNVQFALVALHHWGTPHRELTDENGKPIPKSVNEGIRASSIYNDLATLKTTLGAGPRALIDEVLKLGQESTPPIPTGYETRPASSAPAEAAAVMRTDDDGTAVWNIPLTVAVRLGGAPRHPDTAVAIASPTREDSPAPPGGSEGKLELDPDFSDRSGYKAEFLGTVILPLPNLSAAQNAAAKNMKARSGDNPFELKYHHFSVIMNGERSLRCISCEYRRRYV